VVVADGSGQYRTIAEAVEAAEDGDTVVVRPGIYRESVVIAKDITLRGEGDRDEIIIESPAELPDLIDPRAEDPFALRLDGSSATVLNLTFRGPASAIDIRGGSPWIENVAVIDVAGDGISIVDGSAPEIHRSLFRKGGVFVDGASRPVIKDNEFVESGIQIGPCCWITPPAGTGTPSDPPSVALIEGNIFQDSRQAIFVGVGMSATIEDNTIMNSEESGLFLGYVGPDTAVRRNVIRDNQTAIMIVDGEPIVIDANDVNANEAGIVLSGSASTLRANVVRGNKAGIVIGSSDGGASPTLQGNTIEGNGRGLAIMAGTSPVLSDNVVCDNETNVVMVEGATATLEGNQICAEVASAQ